MKVAHARYKTVQEDRVHSINLGEILARPLLGERKTIQLLVLLPVFRVAFAIALLIGLTLWFLVLFGVIPPGVSGVAFVLTFSVVLFYHAIMLPPLLVRLYKSFDIIFASVQNLMFVVSMAFLLNWDQRVLFCLAGFGLLQLLFTWESLPRPLLYSRKMGIHITIAIFVVGAVFVVAVMLSIHFRLFANLSYDAEITIGLLSWNFAGIAARSCLTILVFMLKSMYSIGRNRDALVFTRVRQKYTNTIEVQQSRDQVANEIALQRKRRWQAEQSPYCSCVEFPCCCCAPPILFGDSHTSSKAKRHINRIKNEDLSTQITSDSALSSATKSEPSALSSTTKSEPSAHSPSLDSLAIPAPLHSVQTRTISSMSDVVTPSSADSSPIMPSRDLPDIERIQSIHVATLIADDEPKPEDSAKPTDGQLVIHGSSQLLNDVFGEAQ